MGAPQVSLNIGPKRWRPSAGGKTARRSLTIAGAFRMGSSGNMRRSRVPVWSPARTVSTSIVRWRPIRPPTPVRVNPKPTWIGGMSAAMTIRNEKPGWPSGSRVSRRPMAVTDTV